MVFGCVCAYKCVNYIVYACTYLLGRFGTCVSASVNTHKRLRRNRQIHLLPFPNKLYPERRQIVADARCVHVYLRVCVLFVYKVKLSTYSTSVYLLWLLVCNTDQRTFSMMKI